MKIALIVVGIVIVAGGVVLLYMRHLTNNSPSIIGGGYDQKTPQDAHSEAGTR